MDEGCPDDVIQSCTDYRGTGECTLAVLKVLFLLHLKQSNKLFCNSLFNINIP